RAGKGNRRDRENGDRVQGQRRHQPVQAAEESAAAGWRLLTISLPSAGAWCAAAILTVAAWAGQPSAQQSAAAAAGEWRSYAGDLRNHHYSPLDEINAENFSSLEVAWRFKTDSLGPRPEYKLEGTPLAVGGMS